MSAVHFISMVVHLIFSIAEAHCLYLNNWWGKFSTIRKIKRQDLLVERKKNISGVKNLNSFLFLPPPSSLQLLQHSKAQAFTVEIVQQQFHPLSPVHKTEFLLTISIQYQADK